MIINIKYESYNFQLMLMAQQVMTVKIENSAHQGIVTSADPSITLIENLSSYVVKDTYIIQFFKELETSQMSQNFIIPISCKQSGDTYNVLYHRFGTSLTELSQQSIQDLITAEFLQQFSIIYYKLKDLRPIISLDNMFIMEKQPCKLLIKSCCQNSSQYIEKYRSIINKLCQNKKQMIEKVKMIKDIQDLKQLYSQPKEGKPLSKILQLKFNFKLQPYKILLEQVDLDWMFKSFGLANTPKYELIYNGINHNFDPIPHLKAISKQQVFYLIQAFDGNKIGFYPGIKYEWNNTALFGGYMVDKQKKSVVVGFKKHSVHLIEDEQFAVGYGSEILMAIGKVDIVFSAFNAQNLSYFPVSYKTDEKAGAFKAKHLLGDKFTLKQFEVYKII